MALEIESLNDAGFDLDLIGFDDSELDKLLNEAGLVEAPVREQYEESQKEREENQPEKYDDEDDGEIIEPPAVPVTKLGDIWVLGMHRLMCGDSTSIDAVNKLMGGKKADMVFTDPPYGVNFQSGMSKGGTASRFDVLKNDDVILDIAPVIYDTMKDDTAAFIWTSHHVYTQWREQFDSNYKQTIIWYKRGGGIGDLYGSYACDFEMALFCVKGRPTFNDKRGMAVWDVSKDAAATYIHPTQKPTALAEKAINDFCVDGGNVLDLFGGSGSTLIAAEKTNRRACIMELDPKYCDVIINRWESMTGKKAVLLSE